ncbi:MAG: hypothetical protein SXA11_10765 [Cyanobacteriota bacterium]|nr:hypothetical protein [Cyanobacteriota bacterium]
MPIINLILSTTLISTFFFLGIYPLPINLAFAETTSQKQEPPTSIFDKIKKAITDKKPPVTERPAGSRGGFCAIAPFSPNETIEVFSDTPIFVWQGKITRIRIIKIGGSEEIVWSVRSSKNETSKVYGGDELQPGQTYDLFFLPGETPYRFRVMDGDRRESIQAELDALAADGDATAEEIALQRAGYFLEEGLLMDALREMLSVENPSVELQEASDRITTAEFCET